MGIRTTPLLLAALFLAPLAGAGSSTNPEVTDGAGDALAPVDVTAAWLTADSKYLYVTIKLSDLGSGTPLATMHSRYVYEAAFSVGSTAVVIEGGIGLFDTTPVGVGACVRFFVTPCAGTSFVNQQGPATTGRTMVNLDQETVTIAIQRANGFTGLSIPSGAVVSGLTITTYTGSSPVEVSSDFVSSRFLTKTDTTSAGSVYFVA